MSEKRCLRVKQVADKIGIGTSTVWRFNKHRLYNFPQGFHLSPGTTVWLESEIDEWLASRPRWQPYEKTEE